MKYEAIKTDKNSMRHEYLDDATTIYLYENIRTREYNGRIKSVHLGIKVEFDVAYIGKYDTPKDAAMYLLRMLKNFARKYEHEII